MQTSTQTNRRWQTALLAGLLSLLAVGASLAQQMNYQGRLTDSAGNAVPDAPYAITFDIYDSATIGTKQWGPQIINADTVQGRFNVILGPTDATSRSIVDAFNGGNKYLQITFQGNPILPRQQILSSPTAFFAQQAGQLASVFVLNGNVGIGKTNPATALDVVGSATISGNTTIAGNSTVAGNATISNNATILGKVGIGTANPAFLLHVQDPGTNTGRIHVGSRAAGGTPKLISFGDGDFVTLGENGQDDTMELTASRFYFRSGSVGIGTTNPAAKLQVVGDIRLGPTGQYQAPAAEEKLRIVRGGGTANVPVDGLDRSPNHGAGFTYRKISQGVVDVTFSAAFAGTPTVTANAVSVGSIFCGLHGLGGTANPSATGFRIVMYDTGANGRDWPFNFIAIGPR